MQTSRPTGVGRRQAAGAKVHNPGVWGGKVDVFCHQDNPLWGLDLDLPLSWRPKWGETRRSEAR